MRSVSIHDLSQYLDQYLAIHDVVDCPGAMNGLQVEGPGEVARISVAVDACESSIRSAAKHGADLLLVHHGLLWGAPFALVGPQYRRFSTLFANRIAVYSSHLPLDVHPEVGNNAVLANRIGIELEGQFAEYQGVPIGRFGKREGDLAELGKKLGAELGREPRLLGFGPTEVRRVGVLTGSGGSAIREAASLGIDTLVTGEASHSAYFDAEELGLNVILAGHYATEKVGVQALARHLEARYGVETRFIDHPTGF